MKITLAVLLTAALSVPPANAEPLGCVTHESVYATARVCPLPESPVPQLCSSATTYPDGLESYTGFCYPWPL